jgi:hypothetical protein
MPADFRYPGNSLLVDQVYHFVRHLPSGILLLDGLLLTASSRAERVRYAALLAVLVGVQLERGTGLRPSVVSLTIIDLLVFAWYYNPLVPARSFHPRPGAVSLVG